MRKHADIDTQRRRQEWLRTQENGVISANEVYTLSRFAKRLDRSEDWAMRWIYDGLKCAKRKGLWLIHGGVFAKQIMEECRTWRKE